jgi:PAS domain S-box-containing protein
MDTNAPILNASGFISESAFRLFLLNNSDIITLVDATGKILFQSSSAKQKMTYGENELKGINILEIVHPDDLKHVSEAFERALLRDGASDRIEFRLRNADGSYLNLEAFGNNQLNNPELKAFIINSRDITPLKNAIEEKNQLILELSKMNEDLEKYNFITTHNMRGPLANILAISNLLQDDERCDEELLTGLKLSAEQLNQTLSDLILGIGLRRSDPIQSNSICVKDLVQTELAQFDADFKALHANILVDINDSLTINFPQNILRYAINAIVKNAIHYRKPMQALELRVMAFENAAKVHIEFMDNGLGLETERIKDRLFGFYQRFHKESSGKGLSLFLVRTKLEALGAKISLKSKLGQGSTFVIEIPIF